MSSFQNAQLWYLREHFLVTLFDAEDCTCFSATPRGTDIFAFSYGINNVNAAFFSINPMDSSKTRADSSVIKYRNILVEFDKMPLNQQDRYVTEIKMPFSTAVFSGSKSVHYIISLEEPLADEQIYRSMVKRVYKAVGEDKVDVSCKNPSRFSRMPGHIRLDTGKEQELLTVKSRVPLSTLESWLESRG